MTWYAQQVFARPRPEVIAALRVLPGLAAGIYHVPHLKEFETEERTVGAILLGGPTDAGEGAAREEVPRIIRRGPQLPRDGLLVVRELCDPEDDHVSEWFGDDALSWAPLAAAGPPPEGVTADLDRAFHRAPDWWKGQAPPPRVLGALKSVADSTRSVVGYVAVHTWGGDTECAFGWVWDGARGEDVFYRATVSTDAEGNERTGFYTDVTGAVAVDDRASRFIAGGDVLTLLLLHFDLLLRDGYFELHTRGFPWPRYKLPPE